MKPYEILASKKMRRTIAFMQSSGTEILFSFILYVDNILLASSDVSLLLETKIFLSSNFDMKDLGEASFVIGIKIH
jgi:hypothetical protein